MVESPVFHDMENSENSWNFGRKQSSQNFMEDMIFMPKITKYGKYTVKKSIKTKQKPIK